MNDQQIASTSDNGRIDIVFVLLVLQAGFGAVSVLGTLAYAVIGGGGAGIGIALVLGFGVPLALLVLAAGIVARRRWARIAVLGFEGLVLLGAAVRLLVGRSMALNLVMLLTTIALPLTVTALLCVRDSCGVAARRMGNLTPSRVGNLTPSPLHRLRAIERAIVGCVARM